MPVARHSFSRAAGVLLLGAAGIALVGCQLASEGTDDAKSSFAERLGLKRSDGGLREAEAIMRAGRTDGRVRRGRVDGRAGARDHTAALVEGPQSREASGLYVPRGRNERASLRGTLPGVSAFGRRMDEREFASSHCRQLHALAGAKAVVLRSPTIGASVNTEEKASVALSYDLVDLRRARLTEEEADARCRRLLALSRLSAFVLTTNEGLRYVASAATSRSFAADHHRLNLVAGQVDSFLDEGLITLPQASVLHRYVARARSMRAAASAEAQRRQGLAGERNAALDRARDALMVAEHDLAEIERRRRTADAVQMTLSGGYNTETDSITARYGEGGDTYGKVKFSVRTGALLPQRHAFEDEATAARLEALNDRGSGMFWRLDELRAASRRALADLRQQRRELRSGLRKAEEIVTVPGHRFGTGLEASRLRARVDAVVFRAELAGVEATIAEMEETVRRLQ